MESPKRIWLISDLHLGHKNIIGFCDRPFKTVEEMDETLISNVNETVGKKDLLWFLGDFAFGSKERIQRYTESIFCSQKSIILGNHDSHPTRWWIESGWTWASRFPIVYLDFIVLSHYQMFMQTAGPYFNVHGHSHNSTVHRPSSRHMNVSCEVIDYRPVNLQYVLDAVKKEGGIIQKTGRSGETKESSKET